jgi:hypothetical protein
MPTVLAASGITVAPELAVADFCENVLDIQDDDENIDLDDPPAAHLDVNASHDENSTADYEVTTRTMQDFETFASDLLRVLEDECTGDVDDVSHPAIDGDLEEDARGDSLRIFKLGVLSAGNNESIPQDRMSGFRGWKGTLADLFRENIVGQLSVMTTFGVGQQQNLDMAK